MVLHDVISWYQKKIGTYDKQQWERTIEERILHGLSHVAKKTAKLKTELIDVDLVRGSSFTKAKPKHGLMTVARLAVARLLLLPLHGRWWLQQTSARVFALLLLLYLLQALNALLYFCWAQAGQELVSASEVLIPVAMMLVLSIVHSQIVSTHIGASRDVLHASSRRLRRSKRKPRSRSRNICCTPKSSPETGADRKSRGIEIPVSKYTKRVRLCRSSPSEGVRQRVVAWDTPGGRAADLPPSSGHGRSEPAGVGEVPRSPRYKRRLPSVASVEGHEQRETTPLDDDGFESLNGNDSSEIGDDAAASVADVVAVPCVGKASLNWSPDPPCSDDATRAGTPCGSESQAEDVFCSHPPGVGSDDGAEEVSGRAASDEAPQHISWVQQSFLIPRGRRTSTDTNHGGSDTDEIDRESATSQKEDRRVPQPPHADSSLNSSCGESEEEEEEEEGDASSGRPLTSAGEWMGVTTNSEECSYSSELGGSDDQRECAGRESWELNDHPFAWEFELTSSVILNPSCAASDKVSCTIWENREVKKADLSVLDISSAIISRVESMPESMDYFYVGVLMSVVLAVIPPVCRLVNSAQESPGASLDLGLPAVSSLDAISSFTSGFSHTVGTLLDISLGSTFWERTMVLIALFERCALSVLFFFLLAVAERTFKQRFLYAKLFSHLTSFRRARKSELPHFRLNKVRNIKTWLSVRSYLKKRGPQRSVDVIVSAAFLITLLLLSFLSVEYIKDSACLQSEYNVEAMVWALVLGVFLLRFMTLGTRINHKYRNLSVLITEQINLYLQIELKPNKKEELMVANSVLKLAADLLKELESPFKISGLSANPYLYTITKVVILSAVSGVLSEVLGFKLKLHKIKIK
ncbi:protein phtf isoform X2 [Bacillus rossius redtenbacheri]|uniref:protein phtf isoform X2 n=1 Tax=Bacillus rossius redtenbacheri TaxID=93214 RepID=UPI002FDD5DE8